MTEIIPTILVKEFKEAIERIKILEALVEWVQIDVVDGKFAPNVTWGNADELAGFTTPLHFEIDLMVADPESAVREWLHALPKVGRIYFHQEASGNRPHNIINHIKKARGHVDAGMSINPSTPIEVLYPFVPSLDAVLLLGVDPGFNASPFHEETIERVRRLHDKFPEIPITVDGGVRPGIAKRLATAGATRLASGSFIFNSDKSPAEQLTALQKDVESV